MKQIIISETAFKKMKQLNAKYSNSENGGFLYGRMNPEWLQILDISDAGGNARRTYTTVEFDHEYLSEYTKEKIKEELYVVGTWHSHPAGADLIPSSMDYSTMKKINAYYSSEYYPVFIISKISKEEFSFSIYKLDENRKILKIENWEICGSGE